MDLGGNRGKFLVARLYRLKSQQQARHQWLMLVILAAREPEIRQIVV
jgi:hypothetical protein